MGRSTAPQALLAVLVLGGASAPASTIAEPAAGTRIIFTQVPAAAAPAGRADHAADRSRSGAELPLGSRIAIFDATQPDAGVRVLTKRFAAAGRPAPSHDASRFLFVGRKSAAEPLSIWEMEIEGGGLRRVAGCPSECVRAIYGSGLYKIDAEAPVPLILFAAGSPAGPRSHAPSGLNLFTCLDDGSQLRQITFNPFGAGGPLLLSDGRLVYSSGSPGGGGSRGGSTLFTINTDGTDVFPFAAPSGAAPSGAARGQGMACETSGGEVVFVESNGDDPLGGGSLVAIPRTRSLAERRAIAEEAMGYFHSPSPLPDGNLLVAFRAERADETEKQEAHLSDGPKRAAGGAKRTTGRQGASTYGLYRLEATGDPRMTLVFDSAEWHEIDAVAVLPRAIPAGRSSAVNDRLSHGELYCLDATISDGEERSPEAGHREGAEGPPAPAVAHVRVYQDGPATALQASDRTAHSSKLDSGSLGAGRGSALSSRGPTGDGSSDGERSTGMGRETVDAPGAGSAEEAHQEVLLGVAPVEPDGSFHLRVPARTPLRLELLDAAGELIRAMRSWIWVMPNEKRGCIGCHESRDLAPPNRHVEALRRPPHDIGVAAPEAEPVAPPGAGSYAEPPGSGSAR